MTAGQMGDAYLDAADYMRNLLTQVRSDSSLTIQVRREAERVGSSQIMLHEASARVCYTAAGVGLVENWPILPGKVAA